MSYRKIDKCRICGNTRLEPILDLGTQALTGVFPKPGEDVEVSPVVLVKCHGEGACGLVQILHSVSLEQMYGENYGYRSGLNKSMIEHLRGMAAYCAGLVDLAPGDVILDVGSNDGTLLRHYLALQDEGKIPAEVSLVGMDPTIVKFGKYYPEGVRPIADFFGAKRFREEIGASAKARIVTSISCFYDLEDPVAFAR